MDLPLKPTRASSAGARRTQQASPFTQTTMATTIGAQQQHTSSIIPDNSSAKVNLPANFSQPLNTSAPINRPKAAAHIIMSSDYQQNLKSGSNGGRVGSVGGTTSPDSYSHNVLMASGGSTIHKSQLEAKVKMVNNNFMSKVPIKSAPKVVNNSAMVYHVMRNSPAGITNNTHGTITTIGGGGETNGPYEESTYNIQNAPTDSSPASQLQQQQQQQQLDSSSNRARIRDPMAKRVPLSNTTVTRTSIVPASTKINYPLPNGSTPSYSVSNAHQGSSANSAPVFDENGLRVDRTPTDEEINWLWDKVRNCLDKEEDGTGTNSNIKQQQATSNNGNLELHQGGKPSSIMSTKLIDGASLGQFFFF